MTAFGGKLETVVGVSPDQRVSFSLSRLEPTLAAAHDGLENAVFENLDWADLAAKLVISNFEPGIGLL
ncbi:hypothetical protein [Pseudophaeobacter sp.]|uniref:hypothetical protein n=1 Tax=Pseudophaeobacter sp. TaxID=1971739 RepID=UPI00329A7A1C